MWQNIGLEQCRSFIECQLRPGGMPYPSSSSRYRSPVRPAITISRMTGSGGRTVASELADYLQSRFPVECRWTVFDKNLVEKVLEEHQLPKRIAEYLKEHRRPLIGDMVEEFLGLHPSSWELVRKTSETILHLAQMGYVILVGRGAGVVTARLENTFHVRLVGSLEKRIERIANVFQMEHAAAASLVHHEDKGQRQYLKENFGKNIDDPLLYHVTINTDRVTYSEAARLIGDQVLQRYDLKPQEELATH